MAHSKVTGYFLSLLKASLDTRQPIPSEKLTTDEWAQIFEMSKKQNMTALLSAGIERLDQEALPPTADFAAMAGCQRVCTQA